MGNWPVAETVKLVTDPDPWFRTQWLIDGSLHGLAALAQRTAGLLSRVQAGNLQRYVLLAGIGLLACVAWVWRHV